MSKEIASESGHFYNRDGEPRYTIIGANGKERNTTLRDARKYGWYPGVTTITKQLASFGLEKWKRRQTLMSALTLPRLENESDEDYIARIEIDADEHSRQAREKGLEIHKWVEFGFLGRDIQHEFLDYVTEAMVAIDNLTDCSEGWNPEKSFASSLGYGGKVDLHNDIWCLDVKTADFDEDKDVKKLIYPEQAMQLAAYDDGLEGDARRCANVFVSRNNPGLVKVYEWPQLELRRAFEVFVRLLEVWQIKNKMEG